MDGASPPAHHPGHDSSISLSNPTTAEDSAPPPAAAVQSGGNDDDDEEDMVFDDNDSAFGGSLIGYDTETIASYVTDYRYENGRRYHAALSSSEYWGPNDELANDQQNLAHHMYFITLEGKLHLAPIVNPQDILDVGTGNGIWAVHIADEYPSAQVLGNDISPIQPRFVPPNCKFEIDDLNSTWMHCENHFDFIHIRELFGCIVDWDDFFTQAFKHTKPGGYVEIIEHSVSPEADDGTVNDQGFFTRWGKTVVELGEMSGKSFTIYKESKSRMEHAGFVEVVEKSYKWPMNTWPSPNLQPDGNDGGMNWKKLRELGRWNQLRLYYGVEGFMLRLLTTVKGWPYEKAQDYLVEMQAALMDLSVHAYLVVTVVYGRKPGGA
ncbi:Velvet complex subunit LAE1 [Hyphodiscus hymeniophilus]|uniref:Velvet complex subunit LAE1 n=1 Tax=Hyphodiscus hymeniophilus TaxID=353542 RepID=A0A9P6VHT5_9HELO|nr:Velvet complex subunit LAE1 [Hyphodiscus hymeniophilus]